MLRSPWPSIGVERVRSLIAVRARDMGNRTMLDEILVAAAREVLSWDEEHVCGWWPAPWGDVARAWRARGRTGEDAAAVIATRLDPDLLARYEAQGIDEGSALAWTSKLYMYGEEGLERALAWSRLGLSPNDLIGLSDADPAEIGRWLAEGFDLDEVRTLEDLALDQAVAWREVHIPAIQVRRLLRADETLTPAEAARFVDLGIDDPVPWVEVGFDAADARAWTDLDVLPNEARVWRAAGHSPEQAGPLLADLPDGATRIPQQELGVSLTITPTSGWTDRPHPPGTRGTQARPRRPHPDE